MLRVDPKKNRLFVEGLNIVKRHQRPRSLKDTQRGGKVGGVIEKEGPIHISNVMVVDPRDNKPTRVRIERTADGRRERVAVRSGHEAAGALMAARLKERYAERDQAAADGAVRLLERRCRRRALLKITLNMGVGEAKQDTKMLDAAVEQLAMIAGQKPAVRRARSRSPASSCARACRSA